MDRQVVQDLIDYCVRASHDAQRCCATCEQNWARRAKVLEEILENEPGQCEYMDPQKAAVYRFIKDLTPDQMRKNGLMDHDASDSWADEIKRQHATNLFRRFFFYSF